ncbi:MAG: transposase [Lentihominibacter sp.]|jgi:transposase
MHYNKAFKEEAVCLSDEIGIKKASEQLGISYNTLAGWRRSKARYGENAYVGSGNRHKPTNAKDQRILNLEKENRELKRANDIFKDVLGFFAESRKK